MRPLERYGVGAGSLDYDLHELDTETYDQLSERGEKLLSEQYEEYMGSFYSPSKKTRDELHTEIKEVSERIAGLEGLEGLDFLMNEHISHLNDLKNQVKNKDYIISEDSEDMKYRKTRDKLEREYYESTERKKLLKEIYDYNETIAKKIMGEKVFSEVEPNPYTEKWLNS